MISRCEDKASGSNNAKLIQLISETGQIIIFIRI